MADITLPAAVAEPRKGLKALVANRFVGLGASGLLFAGAVAGVVALAGPLLGGEAHLRLPLDAAFKAAPAGWREALSAPHGPLSVIPDVFRLSDQPLTPEAGSAAPAIVLPAMTGQALAAATP